MGVLTGIHQKVRNNFALVCRNLGPKGRMQIELSYSGRSEEYGELQKVGDALLAPWVPGETPSGGDLGNVSAVFLERVLLHILLLFQCYPRSCAQKSCDLIFALLSIVAGVANLTTLGLLNS